MGITAFCDFRIRDPCYFGILKWKEHTYILSRLWFRREKNQCIPLGYFTKKGRNCDANLIENWTFESLWNHFEVSLHKMSLEFMTQAFYDFLIGPKIMKCEDPFTSGNKTMQYNSLDGLFFIIMCRKWVSIDTRITWTIRFDVPSIVTGTATITATDSFVITFCITTAGFN